MLNNLSALLFLRSKNLKIYIMKLKYAESVILELRGGIFVLKVFLAFGKEIFSYFLFEHIIDYQ